MILDTLKNSKKYETLSARFAKAFAFLRQVDGRQKLGRHEIDGDEVFALVQQYTTRPLEGAQLEAHRKYIDVQYVHTGRETMLWAPLAAMREENMAYDEKQDAALFKVVPERTPLRVAPGCFTIFYPDDAHAPCLVDENPDAVFKVVVKVKAD